MDSFKLNLTSHGHGPPLILVHGWGWHSGIFEPLIPQLSKEFNVICVDLPGFGSSSMIDDYSFAGLADILLKKLPPSATWLGWSLGGMFTSWIAIHFPHRVKKLITVASSPRFVSDIDWPGVTESALKKFAHALNENFDQTLLDFLELQLRGMPNRAKLFDELKASICCYGNIKPLGLLSGLELLLNTDLRNDLNKIQCQSLHVFGSHDVIVPQAVAVRMQEKMLHGRCEIMRRNGHMPFLDASFLGLLHEWIKE